MNDAYRKLPGDPLARLEGPALVVEYGAALPRLCVLCGHTRGLMQRALRFEHPRGTVMVGPVWLVLAAVVLSALARQADRAKPLHAPMPYWVCKPCELRARDSRQLRPAVVIGAAVGVLGAATAGFNGFPALGVGILVTSLAGGWWLYRRFCRGPGFSFRGRDDGVALTGVHGDFVLAVLAMRTFGAKEQVRSGTT